MFTQVACASLGCGRIIGADEIVFEAAQSSAPCESQRDCNQFGAADPHLCRAGSCVPLLDERPDTAAIEGSCRRVLGVENLESSVPPFVVGAVSWAPAEANWRAELNYELVVREFTQQAGIPVQGSPHLPVVVVCNVGQVVELDRTFDHLTAKLGLPALLTSLPSAELQHAFERVHSEQERSVFMLSPLASTPLLSAVDDVGLLWHVLGPPHAIARAYPPLIRRTEAHLRRQGLDGGSTELRLALLSSTRAEDVDMASYVDRTLILNGKSSSQNGAASYRRYTIELESEDQGRSYAEALKDLFEFRPHIVVPIGGDRYLRELVGILEGAWGQVSDGQRAPFYVLSPYHPGSATLNAALATFPSLNERVIGVSVAVARSSEVYGAYRRNLGAQYPDREHLEGGENFYDAAYFLLFSVAAAGAVPELSGEDIGAGMTRLTAGNRLLMGQSSIADVLRSLENPTTSIALEGTLGAPNFEVATGTRRTTAGSVWCVTRDVDHDPEFHYDVLVLDDSGNDLVGELDCLLDF